MNTLSEASKTLTQVLFHGRSLTQALPRNSQNPGQLKALCFETCRHYYLLKTIADKLLKKPIKRKQQAILCLLYLGIYQLIDARRPAYAIVSESLKAAEQLGFSEAKAVLNGTLRNFSRKQEQFLKQANTLLSAKYSHPTWLIKQLQQAWSNNWQAILHANNQAAPLFIRVNATKTQTNSYVEELKKYNISVNTFPALAQALHINNPVNVDQLPHFHQGHCSVQDISGQFVAELMDLKPDLRLLDACAAPGSKTCHLLERCLQSNIKLASLTVIEKDASRSQLIKDNLARLELNSAQVKLIQADATNTKWWNHTPFNRILLDAPCSATGVIRRHPDIKILRRKEDIDQLTRQQWQLIKALWPLLAKQGLLIYTTCSVLPQENELLIKRFLSEQTNAQSQTINCPLPGIELAYGYQLLPQPEGGDGFYYAVLKKN